MRVASAAALAVHFAAISWLLPSSSRGGGAQGPESKKFRFLKILACP
jgi:hypothetical protein